MSKLYVELRLQYCVTIDSDKKAKKEMFHALQSAYINNPKALGYIDADFDYLDKRMRVELNAYDYTTEDFDVVMLPKIYNDFIRYRFVEAWKEYSLEYKYAVPEIEVHLFELDNDGFNIEIYDHVPSSTEIANFIMDTAVNYDSDLKQRLEQSGIDLSAIQVRKHK